MPDTHTIEGLEIFRTGRWNGDHFSDSDLQAIVDCYPVQGFRAPLKIGHNDTIGERAWGWITRVYKRGNVLLADIADIPSELYRLLKARAYDAVSSEIYYDLERNGRKFRRALKAVALLGSETPAVSDLKPIREVVHAMPPGRFLTFTSRFHMEGSMNYHQDFSDRRIDQRVAALAQQHLDAGRCSDFCEAVQRVLAEAPHLAVEYASFTSIRE